MVLRVIFTFIGTGYISPEWSDHDSCNLSAKYLLDIKTDIPMSFGGNKDKELIIPIKSDIKPDLSVIYGYVSCGISYDIMFNIFGIKSLKTGYYLWLIPRIYNLLLSFIMQYLLYKICQLMRHSDVKSCMVFYCSNILILYVNNMPYIYLNYVVILILWVLFYFNSNKLWVMGIKNLLTGLLFIVGIWMDCSFIFYGIPISIYIMVDNTLLWNENKRKNKAKKTSFISKLLLSSWSSIFAITAIIFGIVFITIDSKFYYNNNDDFIVIPYQMFVNKTDDISFLNMNLYNHFKRHIPILFGLLFIYLYYFMYKYGMNIYFISLFYSYDLGITYYMYKKFKVKSKNIKDINKQLSVPLKRKNMVILLILMTIIPPILLILSKYDTQNPLILTPLITPLSILVSPILNPDILNDKIFGNNKSKPKV